MQEVTGSSPVSSTFWNKKPFDEYVEGFSYFRTKLCVDETAVQTDDFQDSSFGRVVGGKPLIP